MDSIVSLGRMLALEFSRLKNASHLRLAESQSLGTREYGNLIATGTGHTFDRILRRESSKALRSAEKSIFSPSLDLIHLENVTVKQSEVEILQNISLTLQSGDWIAVLGASGSGKSTLLETMVGLIPISKGRIERLGQVAQGKSLRERIVSDVQLLFQDPNDQLLGSDPEEEMMYFSKEKLLPPASKNLLTTLKLNHRLKTPVWELSFGEKKRLALAATLQLEPKILLCDEPTAGLDPKNSEIFCHCLEGSENLQALVWVTHDFSQIPSRIGRVILLKNGKIIFDGPRKEALSPDLLRQADLLP